jgi:hypothetical protein
MNLAFRNLMEDIEEKETFITKKYREMKENFWKFYSMTYFADKTMPTECVEFVKNMFDKIDNNPDSISTYFRAVKGGGKIGGLDGVDCVLDPKVNHLLILGLEEEAKILIGVNEMPKKLQGKEYDKNIYEAFVLSDKEEMKELSKHFKMHKGSVNKL